MKKLIFIGLLILTTSCNAQKNNNIKDTVMLEKFDIEAYKKRKVDPSYDGYYLKDNTYIRQFGNDNSGYVEYDPPLQQFFEFIEIFIQMEI